MPMATVCVQPGMTFSNKAHLESSSFSSLDLFDGRETETVTFPDCTTGLGIKVVGGVDEETNQTFGIFVKRVFAGGLASINGNLKEGDQLLQVNGFCFLEVTNDQAVQTLRQASAEHYVELILSRDQHAKTEFAALLENSYCASSINSTSSSSISSNKQNGVQIDTPARVPTTAHEIRKRNTASSIKTVSDWVESLPQSPPTTSEDTSLSVLRPNTRGNEMSRNPRGLSTPTMSSTPQDPPGLLAGRDFRLAPHVLSMTSDGLISEPSPVLPDHSSSRHHMLYSTTSPELRSLSAIHDDERSSQTTNSDKPNKLDPHIRLHIGKLEVALKYLGLEPTAAQHETLLNQLNIDDNGSVPYGEFVSVARKVFKFELKERSISIAPQFISSAVIQEITDPPAFNTQTTSYEIDSEVFQLQLENDKLKREIEHLKLQLRDRERSCATAEDELLRARQEVQGALEETRLLRNRVQLSEQAQKAAQSIEIDYTDVIHALEAKVANLQAQQAKQLESPAVQRRLAVLSCQVKKSEASKKTYEVATEKLLTFLEKMYEGLQMNTNGHASTSKSERKKLGSLQSLANETQRMIKGVRSLVEIEPLPFGWDDAYTEDGMKYYMNHVTQVTQWTHPVSKVTRTSPRQPHKHVHKSHRTSATVNMNNSNSVMESSA